MSARRRVCIAERQIRLTDTSLIEVGQILHIAGSPRDADWCPIACSADEGIVLPGHVETAVPTCPDCLALR